LMLDDTICGEAQGEMLRGKERRAKGTEWRVRAPEVSIEASVLNRSIPVGSD